MPEGMGFHQPELSEGVRSVRDSLAPLVLPTAEARRGAFGKS
jgi:hypothetical protein